MMTTNFTLPRTLRRAGSLASPKTVRIVILGQAAVGKTALTVRFITKRFIGEYDPTLETIYRHELAVGGDVVRFEILDTAGQEEDALLIEEKIKWGDGFVIVYSVTDRCSFNEVMRLCFLVNHVHSTARKVNAEPPPVVIVANKKDLEFDRMVTTQDGENLSKGLKLRFHEVSAREGCDETAAVFHALCRDVIQLLSSSPTSFRRRAVSKLMEKIPRIHSTATLGSTLGPITALGPTSMLGPTAVLNSTSTLGPTAVLSPSSMLGPTAVLSSSSMLGPTSVLNSTSMLGPTAVLSSSSMLGPTSVLGSSSMLGPTSVLSSSSILGTVSVLSSNSVLGPTSVLGSSSMLGPTSVLSSSSMLGPTSVLGSSSMLGPTSVLSSNSILGTVSVLNSSSVLGPSDHRFSFSSFRDFPQD